MSDKNSSASRTRNYYTIVYPESAPENWQRILADQCVPAFISPLHNKDINEDDSPKKAHYHVMVMFEGPKSPKQARELFDKINGVGCDTINSIRGYARYLCHLDHPDKAQYDPRDIIALAGADYTAITSLVSDKYGAIREMMTYCAEHKIVAYSDLLVIASMNNEGWFRVLCDNGTVVMKEYLKSVQFKVSKLGMSYDEAYNVTEMAAVPRRPNVDGESAYGWED